MIDYFPSWVGAVLVLAISLHVEAASPVPFAVRPVVEAGTPDAEPHTMLYPAGQEILHLGRATLDHKAVKQAKVIKDSLGYFSVSITFTAQGAKLLKELTTKRVGGRLAILLSGRIESAPFIREPITGGEVTITGNFSEADAHNLARKINEAARA